MDLTLTLISIRHGRTCPQKFFNRAKIFLFLYFLLILGRDICTYNVHNLHDLDF